MRTRSHLSAITGFDFVDAGDGATKVPWSMSGENTFLSKAFGLFMSMDDLIGDDYERGLALLDEAARDAAGVSRAKADIDDTEEEAHYDHGEGP